MTTRTQISHRKVPRVRIQQFDAHGFVSKIQRKQINRVLKSIAIARLEGWKVQHRAITNDSGTLRFYPPKRAPQDATMPDCFVPVTLHCSILTGSIFTGDYDVAERKTKLSERTKTLLNLATTTGFEVLGQHGDAATVRYALIAAMYN